MVKWYILLLICFSSLFCCMCTDSKTRECNKKLTYLLKLISEGKKEEAKKEFIKDTLLIKLKEVTFYDLNPINEPFISRTDSVIEAYIIDPIRDTVRFIYIVNNNNIFLKDTKGAIDFTYLTRTQLDKCVDWSKQNDIEAYYRMIKTFQYLSVKVNDIVDNPNQYISYSNLTWRTGLTDSGYGSVIFTNEAFGDFKDVKCELIYFDSRGNILVNTSENVGDIAMSEKKPFTFYTPYVANATKLRLSVVIDKLSARSYLLDKDSFCDVMDKSYSGF